MVKRIILFWCWPEEEDGPRMKVIVGDPFYMECPFCGRRALPKDGIHRWKKYECGNDF